MFAQFKLIWPSVIVYWMFLLVVFSICWFLCTRAYPQLKFVWTAPLSVATAVILAVFGNTVLVGYQNMVLYEYQKKNAPQTASGKSPAPTAAPGGATDPKTKIDPALQMKIEFLGSVDKLIQSPDKLNPDVRKKLFQDYATLFPTPTEKETYFKNIYSVYQCQRYFWEDALAAYQAKTFIKSEARKECEDLAGTFFNREKLIDPANAKNNNETITKLAGHKRLPAAEGKDVTVNEKMIRQALERQIGLSEATRYIFQ